MWILGLKGLINQAPVVQMVDSAIYWINHHPTDQHQGKQIIVIIIHCSHHLSSHWLKAYA